MMTYQGYRNTSDILSEQTRVDALCLCLIRSIVRRYGGTVEMNEVTSTPFIRIPESARAVCFQKLSQLLD